MLRASDATAQTLRAGEVVGGFAWPAGSDVTVPAMLRWSADGGAQLELIEPTDGWGFSFGSDEFVIHMRTSDNDELTLLTSRVRTINASACSLAWLPTRWRSAAS